ncbi:MAG: histidine phosphatase family protein [Ilumatobacteraceae bacterium]
MTRLLLVRHGESNSTVARVIGGPRTCTGLSPLGIVQSEMLRDRWAADPRLAADLVLASNYPRAEQTAAIVVSATGAPAVKIDARFGEQDPGPRYDGMSFAEYAASYSAGVEAWESDDPFAITFPGGETVAAFQYRVGLAIADLLAEHRDATVAIFCHGGVIDSIMRLALKSPPKGMFQLYAANASVTELENVRSGLWRLMHYNDTSHLFGLPAAADAVLPD